MLFEYLKAVIYGIIEGVTEWLPISSTGHLILLGQWLSFDARLLFGGDTALCEQFLSMFNVCIQFGAILAVVCIYFRRLLPTKDNAKGVLSLWFRLIVATVPAALIGLCADALCKHFFGAELEALIFCPEVVASALLIYGLLFILVEKLTRERAGSLQNAKQISLKKALAIGFFQALAIIPGTSRSGATILGARILGVPRRIAAEFSFFMAIPVIGAACMLQIFDFGKYLADSGTHIPTDAILILLVACAAAFFVSLAAIKFLTDFVKSHTFVPFGIYRIALGIAVLFGV